MSRVLRSAAAVLALLALLAGVPAMLVHVVGLPGPSELPSIGDVSAVLQRGPTTDVLVVVLAAVLWVAWARLLLAVLAELALAARPRGRRSRLATGQGPTRRLAAVLVSSLLGIGPTLVTHAPVAAAVTPNAPAAPTADAPGTRPAVAPPDELRTVAASGTWQVTSGDSLWRVAEHALGDGTRWREVHEANLGREVAPGTRYHDGSVLQPGWLLALPAVAARVGAGGGSVVVRPGDSLSAIAARTLGDADRWPELFATNAGRTFGGRTFDDPSLVVAGWTLALPGDVTASTPGEPVVGAPGAARPVAPDAVAGAPADVPSPADLPTDVPAPAGAAVDPVVDGGTPPGSVAEPVRSGSAVAACVPDAAASAPGPSGIDVPPSAGEGTAAGQGDGTAVPSDDWRRHLLLGGGTLLATGLLGMVLARRRAALRGSGRNTTPRLPSPAAQAVEQAALAHADPLAVARVDLALRALVVATSGAARPQWLRREPDGSLAVGLVEPVAAPAPWQSRPDGSLVLAAGTPTSALVSLARSAGTPCPAMVELGRTDDGAVISVDLEAVGLLSLDGPAAAAQHLVRAVLATLATSPMADCVRVVTTTETPALGDRVVRVDHVDAALDAALALAQPVVDAVAAGVHPSTAGLRALDPSEAWDTAVLLVVDAGDEGLPPDLAAIPAGRGLGVVATQPLPGGWRLRARDDARWELEPLGCLLRPSGLAARELDAIATLLLEAAHPITGPATAAPLTPIPAAVARWSATATVDPPPPMRSPWAAPAPAVVAAPQLPLEEEADPDLVAEVAAADGWRFLVRVLGQPDVVDRSMTPVRFEKAKAAELVAWLAEHAGTATRSGARSALWESDVRDATFANVVSEARRALARTVAPPPGEEWIGRGQGERIPLHAGVRSDVEVIRRTARACRDLPDHVAIPALRRVLALVRDVPYAGSGYLWPDADGRCSVAIVTVTSAAADLASRLLDAGDVDGAFWATEQGLRVLPGHEELVCLRMEAHARLGDLGGVRAEYAAYERAVLADPWGDGTIATKVSATRARLIAAHRAPEPVEAFA